MHQSLTNNKSNVFLILQQAPKHIQMYTHIMFMGFITFETNAYNASPVLAQAPIQIQKYTHMCDLYGFVMFLHK